MSQLFKKLNYKSQDPIYILNAPESFEGELAVIKTMCEVKTTIEKASSLDFVLCFASQQQQLDEIAKKVCDKLNGDAVFWVCYPKMSSKKYSCDFNRDTGWQVFAPYRMEGVRIVAIDSDWSALRLRKVEFIKTITRRESFAISKEAKARTTQKGK
ncbi:MAG TPA: hypothetical protein PK006_00870 [Saprospiraceae bacterium]|nr:hypothetical protein [Saprospiraceae bacterium]